MAALVIGAVLYWAVVHPPESLPQLARPRVTARPVAEKK
jgi:hypothetical protein